jgi:glyoxylase-like metal-dependent hydrolase (beta-lactamase superfamily II)
MPCSICTACGTEYPQSEQPPPECPVCEEERQYVPVTGQGWTTLDDLKRGRNNAFRQYEPGLIGIGTEPRFAIGQRALVILTPGGNVLWDCISLIDDATVTLIAALGGLQAIAISHPHFHTTMGRWSRAFGGAPVYLHEDDRDWIRQPCDAVNSWQGETLEILPGVTLIRCGGHFPGASVLHWAGGADGRGIICSGDTVTVATDRKLLTFMRSYPNFIPLPADTVRGIERALEPFPFEAIYGHYFDRVVQAGAKAVLKRSVKRYVQAIAG